MAKRGGKPGRNYGPTSAGGAKDADRGKDAGRSIRSPQAQAPRLFAEVVSGLEDLAERELRALGASSLTPAREGLSLSHPSPYELCHEVRMVAAVYRELRFAVPRPKALLGDAALRQIAAAMNEAAAGGGARAFRFAAAGSDSAVFQRLAEVLSAATGLVHDQHEGGMLLRVLPVEPAKGGSKEADQRRPSAGWDVLVRLTARPLSSRAWRVCNRPGGVNSTVAVAMNALLEPAAGNAYLNLMCGSGTLLVERALTGAARRLVGIDNEKAAVDCAATNLAAAGVTDFELHRGDVAAERGHEDARWIEALQGRSDGLAGGFEELTADAPWGDAVGDHAANEALYPALLTTAARLAGPGARFALLSHEVRLLERLLPQRSDWQVVSSRRLSHGGHRPALMLLKRV